MPSKTPHLDRVTSPLLDGITHAFFGRKGGASSGIFEGLNCGEGSSDQAEIVAVNRVRAAQAMAVEASRLVTVHQVHSARAATLSAPPERPLPKADGVVTATPGLAIAVLTADCQPVLFADREAGVIGAAHAGWRGAIDGVLEATVAAMESLGAAPARIHAVVGPTISQAAYEVGAEFHARFLDDDPENARFFAPGAAGKFQFDLPGYGLKRLIAAGVGRAEWVGHCTYTEAERFFSYRRATHRGEADYGRLLSAIRL